MRIAYAAASDQRYWTQVDKFFEAVKDAKVVVEELVLGNGSDEQLSYDISGGHNEALPSHQAMTYVASKLTHLTISCKDNDEKRDWKFWRNFLSSATNLEKLCVYTHRDIGESWHTVQELGTIFSTVLPHLTFKKLRTFAVIGKLNQPTNVRGVWLNAFLTRHAATLRSLDLSGLLIVNWYKADSTKYMMSSCLRKMRTQLKLEEMKMVVQRRNHHEDEACWLNDDDSACDKTCGPYEMVGYQQMEVAEVVALAAELSVQLRGGRWDFGECVMR